MNKKTLFIFLALSVITAFISGVIIYAQKLTTYKRTSGGNIANLSLLDVHGNTKEPSTKPVSS